MPINTPFLCVESSDSVRIGSKDVALAAGEQPNVETTKVDLVAGELLA